MEGLNNRLRQINTELMKRGTVEVPLMPCSVLHEVVQASSTQTRDFALELRGAKMKFMKQSIVQICCGPLRWLLGAAGNTRLSGLYDLGY